MLKFDTREAADAHLDDPDTPESHETHSIGGVSTHDTGEFYFVHQKDMPDEVIGESVFALVHGRNMTSYERWCHQMATQLRDPEVADA